MNKNIKTKKQRITIIVPTTQKIEYFKDFDKEFERRYWTIKPKSELKKTKRKD